MTNRMTVPSMRFDRVDDIDLIEYNFGTYTIVKVMDIISMNTFIILI